MSDREIKFYLVANFRNGRKVKMEQLKLLKHYNKIKNNSIKYGGIANYLESLGFSVQREEYKANEYDEYLMSKRKRLSKYA